MHVFLARCCYLSGREWEKVNVRTSATSSHIIFERDAEEASKAEQCNWKSHRDKSGLYGGGSDSNSAPIAPACAVAHCLLPHAPKCTFWLILRQSCSKPVELVEKPLALRTKDEVGWLTLVFCSFVLRDARHVTYFFLFLSQPIASRQLCDVSGVESVNS